MTRAISPTLAFAVVLAAAAVAFASPFRQPNCNTSSHYVLVQSIASGSSTIDSRHGESCDIAWWNGHYYANKAPGLALATVPWYELVRAVGLIHADRAAHAAFPAAMRAIPRRDLWLMALWGAVLPALGLLILVRRAADKLEPGSGTAVAATLGFGSILLPFASLFFSHALAAFLAFAAFMLVMESSGRGSGRVLAAGVLAGFGVVVEYPLALFALVLGVFVASRRPYTRNALAFAAGAALGLAPLLVFDAWAFGSPFHLSYAGAVLVPGVSGHDVLGANSAGFYGVRWPSFSGALQIMFGVRGLLSLGPVLALAPLGVVLLWRRGRRREASFITAVCVLFLVYNAGYYSPLGGATPGPRFLVCILGFAALALAPLVRRVPLSFLVLLTSSAAVLLVAHITQPLISPPYNTGDWWRWIRGEGYSSMVFAPTSHDGLAALPLTMAALVALAVVAASLLPSSPTDLLPAGVVLGAWCVGLAALPQSERFRSGGLAAAIAVIALSIWFLERQRRERSAIT
ncbi:MAG TPA: hypothetical protein VLK36_06810 [Gaiellaceae bacterium]|nr:hypothetical protein [Gaiellaceae bacterium]